MEITDGRTNGLLRTAGRMNIGTDGKLQIELQKTHPLTQAARPARLTTSRCTTCVRL